MKLFLDEGQKNLEKEMLKILPPEERQIRRRVAMLATICLFSLFGWAFYRVYKVLSPQNSLRKGWDLKRYWQAYLVLIPAVLTIAIWQYYPLLRGSAMAFQDYKVAF